VKALAWSPHCSATLASGGGSNDRCIKLWDVHSHKLQHSISTNSQICNMAFSRLENELVVCYGFSENVVAVWDLKTKKNIATLFGHS
jgi:cell division cycle 20-like protein 1 (cofactor of APC complex)